MIDASLRLTSQVCKRRGICRRGGKSLIYALRLQVGDMFKPNAESFRETVTGIRQVGPYQVEVRTPFSVYLYHACDEVQLVVPSDHAELVAWAN